MAFFGLFGSGSQASEKRDAAQPFLDQVKAVGSYLAAPIFGSNVNANTSFKLAAAYNAIVQIAQDMAVLSLDHVRKDDNGFSSVVYGPLHTIVHNQVNPALTSYQWRLTTNLQALTEGNSFSVIVRNARGQVLGLDLYKDPGLVKIFKGRDENGLPVLYYHIPGYPTKLHMSDVLHTKYFTLDGIVGVSPITYHAETIGTQLSAQELNKSFWESGGFIKGILKIAGKLTPQRRDDISDQWTKGQKGYHIPVLDQGSDYQAISISQKDAMYIETRAMGVEDVARMFNIPLSKLKVRDLKYNTQEQQALEYVISTLSPLIKASEQELTSKLLFGKDREYIKYDYHQLLRGDINTRSRYYKDMFYMGAISPNEIRKQEGYSARNNGDDYFTPVNAYSADQLELIIENLKKQGENE